VDAITLLWRQPCRLRLVDLKAACLPGQAKPKRGTQFCSWAIDGVYGSFSRDRSENERRAIASTAAL